MTTARELVHHLIRSPRRQQPPPALVLQAMQIGRAALRDGGGRGGGSGCMAASCPLPFPRPAAPRHEPESDTPKGPWPPAAARLTEGEALKKRRDTCGSAAPLPPQARRFGDEGRGGRVLHFPFTAGGRGLCTAAPSLHPDASSPPKIFVCFAVRRRLRRCELGGLALPWPFLRRLRRPPSPRLVVGLGSIPWAMQSSVGRVRPSTPIAHSRRTPRTSRLAP